MESTRFEVYYFTLQSPLSLANWLNINLFTDSLYYTTKLLTAQKLLQQTTYNVFFYY
jgi:hypothetical protein